MNMKDVWKQVEKPLRPPAHMAAWQTAHSHKNVDKIILFLIWEIITPLKLDLYVNTVND